MKKFLGILDLGSWFVGVPTTIVYFDEVRKGKKRNKVVLTK